MQSALLTKKIRATAIHFFISLNIFMILAAIIYYSWFPQPYFYNAGGLHGLKLIAIVDLALGPLLTFIVFDPKKTRQAFTVDYTFIITIQLLAISYGMHATYTQRPLAIVYSNDKFQAVVAEMLSGQNLDIDKIHTLSDEKPPLLFSRRPEADGEANGVIMWQLMEGVPKHALTFLHERLSNNMGIIISNHAETLANVISRGHYKTKLDGILLEKNLSIEDIVIAPFSDRYGEAWLVLNKNGKLIGAID